MLNVLQIPYRLFPQVRFGRQKMRSSFSMREHRQLGLRVALPHPDWAKQVLDAEHRPSQPPFTPEELLQANLSPTFVEYMRRWKGFVTDGR